MDYNYSLYSVPAAFVVAISPHWYAVYLTAVSADLKFFNNTSPRSFLASVQNQEKQSAVVQRFIRAESSSLNNFENLGLFAAAVAIGNASNLAVKDLNALTGFYLLSRVLYNILYIQTTKKSLSGLRSLSYLLSIGAIMTLFVKSGIALNAK